MRYSYERRALGFMIDIIVALLLAILVVTISPYSIEYALLENVHRALVWYTIIFFIYAFVCYFVFNGLTLGRFLFKTALKNKDLTRMNIKTCFVRALLQSFLPLIIVNAIYMVLYRSTESFYDKITDTTSIMID